MKRRLYFGVLGVTMALVACSPFVAADTQGSGDEGETPGMPGDDAGADSEQREGAPSTDSGSTLPFCAAYQGLANTYCVDFDNLPVGPAPAPFTFGAFTTAPASRDPLDRAEWDVVASDASSPNAGRLRVASPDGGVPSAVRAAMEVSLAQKPSRITCRLAWRVVTRAPKITSFPENLALLTLFYKDGANTEYRLSLVTNTLGEAQLYRPNLAPSAQLDTLAGLEGLGWRRAQIVFDLPAPGASSFIEVTPGGSSTPLPSISFSLADSVNDLRLLVGPDYVSTYPWDVLFDDVVCTIAP